ncbi:SDR family NAD(P)-dependent oxidoreductase [Conexibacter sp. W3-3-2]|nr:SDR family NAD(P)-dependent oxidoreductase [Conexibacter sp. W3-3-2]
MARATLAPVIGRPTSWSQNRVWRYSSSATVACGALMASIVASDRPVSGYARAMEIGPGTRAFVTGASRGIGRALAQELAARGAVVGLAARNEQELAELAASLPGSHHVFACDVSDDEAVRAAIDGFVAQAGGLDLLVANAGITHYGPFRDQPLEHARRMTDINWYGTLYTVHHGLPHLLDAAHGHIVVVSSGAALRSFPWAAVYGATKAAQRMFAEALRHELSGTGVSLTTVFPGRSRRRCTTTRRRRCRTGTGAARTRRRRRTSRGRSSRRWSRTVAGWRSRRSCGCSGCCTTCRRGPATRSCACCAAGRRPPAATDASRRGWAGLSRR